MRTAALLQKRPLAAIILVILYHIVLVHFHLEIMGRPDGEVNGLGSRARARETADSPFGLAKSATISGYRQITKDRDKCFATSATASGTVIEEVFDANKVNNMSLFHCYPLNLNFKEMVRQARQGKVPVVPPINRHPYKPLTTVNCGDKNHFIVYLIKSRPKNGHARDVIRRTWGNENVMPHVLVKRVFLLGISTEYRSLPFVFDEQQKHGDILMENFPDVYLHTRIKMTMGFRWATSHCHKASFIVFADDDVIINPWRMITHLSSKEVREQETLYSGALQTHYLPHRSLPNKWFLSINEYPFEAYPTLAPAGTMIVNMEFARQFVVASPYISPVHYDDVYLAIVARKLGVKPSHTEEVKVYCSNYAAATGRFIACLGEFNSRFLWDMWSKYHINYYENAS